MSNVTLANAPAWYRDSKGLSLSYLGKKLFQLQQSRGKQALQALNIAANIYGGDYKSAIAQVLSFPRQSKTYTPISRSRRSSYSYPRRYRRTKRYRRSFKRSYRSYKRYSRYWDRRRRSYARERRRYTRYRRYTRRYRHKGYRSYTGRGRFGDSGSARHRFHFNTGKRGYRYTAYAGPSESEAPYPGAIHRYHTDDYSQPGQYWHG